MDNSKQIMLSCMIQSKDKSGLDECQKKLVNRSCKDPWEKILCLRSPEANCSVGISEQLEDACSAMECDFSKGQPDAVTHQGSEDVARPLH